MIKRICLLIAAVLALFSLSGEGKKEADSSLRKVRIGVMPDPGNLPLLLMDEVEVVPFMSAKERDAALMAGELDGISGDMVGLFHFQRNGQDMKILTLTECRFLLVAQPDFSGDTYEVGISENTVIEYMVDTLLEGENVVKNPIPQVPVRMEMLRTGQLPMACLTDGMAWPLLNQGFQILRDQADTTITPTILAFSGSYLEKNSEMMNVLTESWNRTVKEINDNPGEYHGMLLEQIRLPEAKDFPMPEFDGITLPTEENFQSVKGWYENKYGVDIDFTLEDIVVR